MTPTKLFPPFALSGIKLTSAMIIWMALAFSDAARLSTSLLFNENRAITNRSQIDQGFIKTLIRFAANLLANDRAANRSRSLKPSSIADEDTPMKRNYELFDRRNNDEESIGTYR